MFFCDICSSARRLGTIIREGTTVTAPTHDRFELRLWWPRNLSACQKYISRKIQNNTTVSTHIFDILLKKMRPTVTNWSTACPGSFKVRSIRRSWTKSFTWSNSVKCVLLTWLPFWWPRVRFNVAQHKPIYTELTTRWRRSIGIVSTTHSRKICAT